MMLAMWRATVAELMPSSSAMTRLDRPLVIRPAISSSPTFPSASRGPSISGELKLALAGLDPAKAREAASHLRPGIDLAQDRERLEVVLPRLRRVTGQPGEVTEAEQRPGDRPLLIDVPGDRERALA